MMGLCSPIMNEGIAGDGTMLTHNEGIAGDGTMLTHNE